MKISVSLILLVCSCGAAIKLKEPKATWEPHDELFLRTYESLRTLGMYMPSLKYKFQDQYFNTLGGANVHIFGVKTSRAARITLHDSSGKQPDIRFTLNKEVPDQEEEWECSVTYMDRRDPTSFYIPCYLDMQSSSMMWFTILSKKGYLAIYENGVETPVLDLTKKDLDIKDINFNKYDSYTVSSETKAIWDFQGHMVKDDDLYEPYLDKRLTKALKRSQKNYLAVKKQSWKCYHAVGAKGKEKDKTLKFKYAKFVQKNCYMGVFQPYTDATTRQGAILRVNGIKFPSRSEFDVVKWFKERYSP